MSYGRGFAIAGAILTFLAIFALPYGFYTFARIAITVVAIVVIIAAVGIKRLGWLWVFIPIAILWNPLIPVYLSRDGWLPLDLLAAAGFILFAVLGRAKVSAQPTDATGA